MCLSQFSLRNYHLSNGLGCTEIILRKTNLSGRSTARCGKSPSGRKEARLARFCEQYAGEFVCSPLSARSFGLVALWSATIRLRATMVALDVLRAALNAYLLGLIAAVGDSDSNGAWFFISFAHVYWGYPHSPTATSVFAQPRRRPCGHRSLNFEISPLFIGTYFVHGAIRRYFLARTSTQIASSQCKSSTLSSRCHRTRPRVWGSRLENPLRIPAADRVRFLPSHVPSLIYC